MNEPGFYLLLLSVISFHVRAQVSGSAASEDGSLPPSLLFVIGVLILMFSLTLIVLMHANFCRRRDSAINRDPENHPTLTRSRSRLSGIDRSVIESLPFFRFSSLKGSKEGLECAVCLSKFEDVEILRLLPQCKHAFHIHCIDHWLEKHPSCPLCRHKLHPKDQTILKYSNSFRLPANNQSEVPEESNIELFVQREEEHHGSSSRFSIGSSFRRIGIGKGKGIKEEELPIQNGAEPEDSDGNQKLYHKHNHKITMSDVMFKNRWSNVSSSDLVLLNSEMLKATSSKSFSNLESNAGNSSGASKYVNPGDKRSMSEITTATRFEDLGIKNRVLKEDSILLENNLKEQRMRQLWLPIARTTAQWFVNRETRPQQFQNKQQPFDV